MNLSLITVHESETSSSSRLRGAGGGANHDRRRYGMNFEHSGAEVGVGYPLAVGLMVVIDVYLFFRFRKAKWALGV